MNAYGIAPLLAHPRDRAAGVEAARERDADPLADRQRGEDDALRNGADGHAAPCEPLRADLVGELGAGERLARDEHDGVLARDRARDVRMPGDVDRLGERARVAVRRREHDQVAARLDRQRPARQRLGELLAVAAVLGERVDEPAARVAHLDQAELVDVARYGRLHDLVALASQAHRRARPASRAAARGRVAGSRHGARCGSCVQHLREDLEGMVDVRVVRRRAAARAAGRSRRR